MPFQNFWIKITAKDLGNEFSDYLIEKAEMEDDGVVVLKLVKYEEDKKIVFDAMGSRLRGRYAMINIGRGWLLFKLS